MQPFAWMLAAVVAALMAWQFLLALQAFLQLAPKLGGLKDAPGVTDLVAIPVLRSFSNLLMLLVPLITMRTIAGERRAQSLALLLASGVGNARIVIGKYFGAFGFVDRAHRARRGNAVRARVRHVARFGRLGRGCSWTRPVRRCADRDRRALLVVDCAAGARRRRRIRDHEPACDRRRRRAAARASTTPASIISRCRRISSRSSAGSYRASTSSISCSSPSSRWRSPSRRLDRLRSVPD